MSIEVTSVPDPDVTLLAKRPLQSLKNCFDSSLYHRLVGYALAIAGVVSISCALAVIRSYSFYAHQIDARLASGYLTSRPGLYAAPKTIQPGQKLTIEKLEKTLRRAGYVETTAGGAVWSGSFKKQAGSIEILPNENLRTQPKDIRVEFASDSISALSADGITLDSFTLEPEPLANDISSKAGQRELLNYDELPIVLVHAILAIEDHRFFDHAGVDLTGLARAFLRNAGDERIGQGGSTITQQLIKNTYLSPERTLQRKYAEAMLAIALERRLSKQDILALYCNEVYLGQRGALAVRGMKQGARVYFGKDLKDLSLAEAATLAGMIQGPSRYSPVRHPDAALARRNSVLASMNHLGWTSLDQFNETSKAPITVSPARDVQNSLAPYFVDYVNRVAEDEFDASGMNQRIYTTIDLELQEAAEEALKKQLEKLDKGLASDAPKPQAALVALDPHTGNILAMVGGRNYAESQLNRATDARRQPGSTFKPFVYAAALEDGMSPVQTFLDAPRDFVYDRDKTYRPSNYGGGYTMHEVTLRTGLVKSLNVVTVDVALQTGLARIANLATRFGLPKPERYPSLALGTKEVTPLELAAAYATFANEGQRVKSRVIASIGETPGAHVSTGDDEVIKPTTAYMITNMLSAVIDRGTAKSARGAVKGTSVAGKTGTSRDGWFVGYSPNLVCAVWVGYDDNAQLGLTGAEAALPAWVDFMNASIAMEPDLGAANFDCPEGIKFVEIDSATGLLSTLGCPLRELIAVTEQSQPRLQCYLHENVPYQGSPFAEENNEIEETVVAQHSQGRTRSVAGNTELKNFKGTRVDVDAQGRRTLTNELR